MEYIAVGCDVSKGRCDIAIINQSGTLLSGSGGYDDIRLDHERLRGVLMHLHEAHPNATILVGLESTGGLERNWMSFFRSEKRWEKLLLVHHLNPMMVKRYLDAELHRSVTDRSAAHGIARFLLERQASKAPKVVPMDGKTTYYRLIRAQIQRRSEATQRLQSFLPAVQPELVQYCRSGMPQWVLALLERYPTATKLGRAQQATVAQIPHLHLEMAEKLVSNAKTSVAALDDAATEIAVRCLVREIQGLSQTIEEGQAELLALLANDPRVAVLESIPGIGRWSAVALVLEIGDIARFATVRSLIAWAGLDPREDVSGDGIIRRGISHRGNAQVRALLFMNALSAITHNPGIAAFYTRLTTGDRPKPKKVALVACMGKLLRIIYALMCSGRPFDTDHERSRAQAAAAARQAARSQTPAPTPRSQDIVHQTRSDAPVSAREAKRRRLAGNKATAPCPKESEVKPQAGSGAVATPLCRTHTAAKRRRGQPMT